MAEIRKHSGGQRVKVQIATIIPEREIRMIDLSGNIPKNNYFISYLRKTVDNDACNALYKALLFHEIVKYL